MIWTGIMIVSVGICGTGLTVSMTAEMNRRTPQQTRPEGRTGRMGKNAETLCKILIRYDKIFKKRPMSRFVGPTGVFVSGDTLRIKDCGKTDWPWYFDGEAKQKRHETVFPEECGKAFEMGIELAK